MAPYGSSQPESSSVSVELPYVGVPDYVRTYGDEPSMNSPDSMGRKSNSFQYSERNNQFGNPSMPNDGHVSLHQSNDGSDSFDHTIIGNSLSDDEKSSLCNMQPQGGMGSYRNEAYQQVHNSLQNLSLQEPQANWSLEYRDSPVTKYTSYNRHNYQNTSQNQPPNVVTNNNSAMLGEVNHSVDQHQLGRPNVRVGASQFTLQQQAAKVVLPNRSAVLGEANHNINQTGRPNDDSIRVNQNASQYYSNKVVLPNRSGMLGEANHSIYLNQAGRPSDSIGINQNASQYYPNKVVLPNHSAVLGERNQSLPSDAQHQSSFSMIRSAPVSSADQTALSSQNISLPSKGMEVQRNCELDMQNPQNNIIPPTIIQDEDGSNDQKNETHSQDQHCLNTVVPPPGLVHEVLQQNHVHVESKHMQHSDIRKSSFYTLLNNNLKIIIQP